MKVNLTPDEWAQASFCVYLNGGFGFFSGESSI